MEPGAALDILEDAHQGRLPGRARPGVSCPLNHSRKERQLEGNPQSRKAALAHLCVRDGLFCAGLTW
jgi:hypothetical protein